MPDFNKILLYAASKGKKEAIALVGAQQDVSLLDLCRSAHCCQPLTIEEKREIFYKSYASTIDWLFEDRQEVNETWTFAEDRFTDYANWSRSDELESMI